MNKVAIFIPVYCCGLQTVHALSAFTEQLKAEVAEILIIDNASEDGSGQLIFQYLEKSHFPARLIVNEKNLGLGGSFKLAWEGFQAKGYSHLVIFHGDHQANIEDLHKVVKASRNSDSTAAILGARFAPGSKLINYSWSRAWANRLLNILLSKMAGQKIDDLGSGLASFRLRDFNSDFIQALPSHIAFDLHILFYLLENKLPMEFLPIQWKRAEERSTISAWRVGFYLLREILGWRGKNA